VSAQEDERGVEAEPDDDAETMGRLDEPTPPAAPAARRRIAESGVHPGVGSGVHNQPTQQLPASRGLPPGPEGDTRYSTATSPIEAMRLEEVERTRVFLKFALGIVLAAVIAVWLAGGDRIAQLVVTGGCIVVAITATWMIVAFRYQTGFTTERLTIGAIVIAIGAFGGVYYWGVVSPATALILYGIYFFSFGGSQRSTLGVYLWCASLHAAMATAVGLGWIADRGIIRATDLPWRHELLTHLVVQFLYLCAYLTGRASRKTTLEAVSALEKAVRQVSQREALLAEARQELDRALKVGGPGRYTDQEVGSFRLGMLIGRGGMGEVYEATSVHDGSIAAVKLLTPGTMSDHQHLRRFLREAEAAAKLDSPNVVAVLEVGTTAAEIPFLAMERLRGFDLAHHLRRRRRLALGEVVTLVEQIGAGLEAARVAGVIHRDIKPNNLFLAEKDGVLTWKVLDFGVSKLAGQSGTLTKGHVVGTPGYMAPEQARGEDVDWRADLYALAAIAYRALTGHPPFTGKDVPSTLYDVVYKMPTQPSQLHPLPADIESVLAVGMAKLREARFQSADELAAALMAAARGELDVGLRSKADLMLSKHPWGQRL
jgi:eukaryotic-like serine/threonine-protein kinase